MAKRCKFGKVSRGPRKGRCRLKKLTRRQRKAKAQHIARAARGRRLHTFESMPHGNDLMTPAQREEYRRTGSVDFTPEQSMKLLFGDD